MNGVTHGFALDSFGEHDRAFIDIPPGSDSLTVSVEGGDAAQNDALRVDLVRVGFDAAFAAAPFAAAAPDDTPAVTASGSGGVGPTAELSGAALQPGRWYVVVRSIRGVPSSVSVRADVTSSGNAVPMLGGLWRPTQGTPRENISQGYEYTAGGPIRAMIWYTYDEQNRPVWYLVAEPSVTGNIWVGDLWRYTNDGIEQKAFRVGRVSITMLDEYDQVFSFTLFGQSGSDRMMPNDGPGPLTCPQIGGQPRSYRGLWFNGLEGLGGASVLVNSGSQAQIHYLFGGNGEPFWVLAADGQSPTSEQFPILQFRGFCAVCEQGQVTTEPVGTLTRAFTDETSGSWTLFYDLNSPLAGTVNRTESIVRITDQLPCQ
jgi:hypothetical protein